MRATGVVWNGCAGTCSARRSRWVGWSGAPAGECCWLSPLELVEKLAAIVPPPRSNQTLYAGVLAGNAAWRSEVVPNVPTSTEAEREARAALKLVKAEDRRARGERAEQRRCWAELFRRVFEYDALVSHYLL